jgi:hypothetical protein
MITGRHVDVACSLSKRKVNAGFKLVADFVEAWAKVTDLGLVWGRVRAQCTVHQNSPTATRHRPCSASFSAITFH